MMKYAKYVVGLVVVTLFLSACQPTQKKNVLFDASQLTHQLTPKEVIRLIGVKPDTSFRKSFLGKQRFVQMYDKMDSTEIRFAHNKLLEVIVHKPAFPYVDSSIIKFGLPFHNPTKTDTAAFILWNNSYKNFEIVNFYKVGSKQDNRPTRYKIYFRLKQ